MASAETRTLLAADVWASSTEGEANRQNPEAIGLTRTTGYGLEYQQLDSGFYPSRQVLNQRYHEWELGFRHKLLMGIPEYDSDVDYRQHAFAVVGGTLYVATEANGPTLGNPTDPTALGQTVWREY